MAGQAVVLYHFHDTSAEAGVRRPGELNDNQALRPEGANLAAFLWNLRDSNPLQAARIRDAVRLAAPFFDDFLLRPMTHAPHLIQLEWRQKGSDFPFRAVHLSDGTLRFICLATALLQPVPPSTILVDEPELGLHPHAIELLAALFRKASSTGGSQIIVSTQSAALLSEFAPEDVVVVERERGESVFRRLDVAQLAEWLEEYGLGELWQKNVLGASSREESIPAFQGGSGRE